MTTITSRTVTVRFDVDGYHRWPAAPPARSYLEARHRHRFGFTVTIPVDHDERQVEFHDLLDWCTSRFDDEEEFGDRSCETIAGLFAGRVVGEWKVPWCECSVSEDGYVTATLRVEAAQ